MKNGNIILYELLIELIFYRFLWRIEFRTLFTCSAYLPFIWLVFSFFHHLLGLSLAAFSSSTTCHYLLLRSPPKFRSPPKIPWKDHKHKHSRIWLFTSKFHQRRKKNKNLNWMHWNETEHRSIVLYTQNHQMLVTFKFHLQSTHIT